MTSDFSTSGFSDALVILGAAGIVIPAGLGSLAGRYPWLHYVTISNAHAIDPFAELGIILLLFSIGLELSFRRLWSMRRLVFGAGAAELLGSAAIIGAGLLLMGQGTAGAIAL